MTAAPPPQIDSSTGAVGGQRDFLGWFYLALLLALVVWSSFAAKDSHDEAGRLSEAEQLLHHLVNQRAAKNSLLADPESQVVQELEKALAPSLSKNPVAAEIEAATQTFLGRPVSPDTLKPLLKSKAQADRDAATLFSSPKLSPADAQRLSGEFKARGFVGALMSAEAYCKAGDPKPLQSLTNSSASKWAAMSTVIGILVMCSIGAWTFLLSEKASGRMRPLGFKVPLPALFDADRLAVRAAALMLTFLLITSAPSLIGLRYHFKMDERLSSLLIGLAMLAAVLLLFQRPVLGRRVPLGELGVDGVNLGRNIALGLFGFVLELPVAMILLVVGTLVFPGQHPSHPVTTELQASHDPLLVASQFFLAAVVAPFWEEIMFRGLLFPALTRVTGRVIYGAVISSFLFGTAHPQGPPLWLSLMAVAGMSCALTYHTRSLVPSIVMHAAHNTAILVFAVMYS